jgi:hypothetical protein
MVKQLPNGNNALPAFSPDEQWLMAGRIMVGRPGEYRVWRTGSWDQAPSLPTTGRGCGALAFCPHVNFLAVSPNPGRLQLLEVGSWKKLAILPTGDPYSFSQDGSRLVTKGENGVRVWDLRALRRQLDDLKLDWDLPPLASPQAPHLPTGPWTVISEL